MSRHRHRPYRWLVALFGFVSGLGLAIAAVAVVTMVVIPDADKPQAERWLRGQGANGTVATAKLALSTEIVAGAPRAEAAEPLARGVTWSADLMQHPVVALDVPAFEVADPNLPEPVYLRPERRPLRPDTVVERPTPPPPDLFSDGGLPDAQAPPAIWTGEPMVAVIIDDLGPNVRMTRAALELPPPLTLAFLPEGDSSIDLADQARTNGFELFLHMPMEPRGPENPGPNALRIGQEGLEVQRRINDALALLGPVAGVNNHMGSRVTADPEMMDNVMRTLAQHELVFVDSLTTAASVSVDMAKRHGIEVLSRDIFLDHNPSPAAIRRQLAQMERVSKNRGFAIGIGHPYPATLAALRAWLPGLGTKGIRRVTINEMIALLACEQGRDLERCGQVAESDT
ncbi:MAG: divergent polysaccharide deacetylase family protein [Geminicoccaceae bacterium]